MWVSTFHSACVRILRREVNRFGYTSAFSIYDSADSKRLMTLVCRELDLDPKRYSPRAVLAWVSNAKNDLLDHEAAAALLVKVMARIDPGWACCSAISQAIRRVRTRVLPDPAPATTRSGPPG